MPLPFAEEDLKCHKNTLNCFGGCLSEHYPKQEAIRGMIILEKLGFKGTFDWITAHINAQAETHVHYLCSLHPPMDWTLSITLFQQVLMCLMKLYSTTRRRGGSGSILIIKGDVNRATKVAGFYCKAATCSCDEKCLHGAQQFHCACVCPRPPLLAPQLKTEWNKSYL